MENNDYLIDEIIEVTKDKKSLNFWKKAIKELGSGIVGGELHELKYQINTGNIKHPAKYFTALLKKQMSQGKKPASSKPEKLETYFEKTQLDLFRHLKPVKLPENEKGQIENIPLPYSGKNIPWPTFIGPDFFTLSTNKKRSDTVKAQFHSLEDPVIETFLTRGKISPDSKKEFGIPNIQHWRVFAALEFAWAQGNKHIKYQGGTSICHVTVAAKELARILGWEDWQHLGKNNLLWLRDIIAELKSMPYYLHLEDLNLKGIKGYGFYLIGDVTILNKKAPHGEETLFSISFSSTVSWQLLQKHAVIRSKEMLYVYNEMASLIWIYLEPNLRSHGSACINLINLIEILHLPKADWHKYPSMRKREFEKAVKELNGQNLADGRKIIVKIEKGLYDWQLVAHLEGYAIKQLE